MSTPAPKSQAKQRTGKRRTWSRLKWCAIAFSTILAVTAGTRWAMALKNMEAKPQPAPQVAVSEQGKREYVLEIIGLGVTLDKYRQGKLWEALQKGSPHVTIREQDAKKYPWDAQERKGMGGGRGGDSLENGAQFTPMYYGVPVFNAQSPIADPEMADQPNAPYVGLAAGAVSSGMAWHLFVVGPRRFGERPDRILDDVFAFFDANPDVPYIVLNSEDSMGSRDSYRPDGAAKLIRDGYYIPEMPDASALFVLARRERVDAVRPFAFDDVPPEASVDQLNQYGVARRLFLAYTALERTVPHPDKEKDPEAYTERQPLIAEWLPVAAQFAQRPDIRGTGVSNTLKGVAPWVHYPPKNWKPTPWFPIPWNNDQLDTFDRLPTLGFLHRPTFVKFADEHGKPLTRRDEREKVLQAGWQQALQTLPEAQRLKAPARIIAATGGNTEQLIALHSTLNAYAAQGGPVYDNANSEQFIDTDKRLGNTGAATLFVQMGIGVIGSYRSGGVSAAINLRDGNEASIILISPPSDAARKAQHRPNGDDVFGNRATPMIDPANYPPN
ncbi:type VI lipase adapter Tla3 domain-containing protein [Janthinobacterium fluminis]|uniref:DUF2875 family protein n=1 Tax=Janthinobacterium fluminis TaxID=2987524 RepID=A0ABT5JWY4_9BURK|nr:DUF2875 family protein [Janthinobacterium fluminis]MDC8756673.1 DUF2875 family protein [Janthinobacterium fluminis]